eukprot:CAMPEP_0170101686 /NCGR_PEP_ID=MMETSP0020_2-20130122/2405_1 /TAXON_ID=98059 /ORGANISM="Dinobryon sp., Strain UTEXLB2267" /LENGTH=119 /DNA_ID=CAMNT_0010324827 /DNA_START=3085 /DNA_END=3444 /DNA_ORIENTATION=+
MVAVRVAKLVVMMDSCKKAALRASFEVVEMVVLLDIERAVKLETLSAVQKVVALEFGEVDLLDGTDSELGNYLVVTMDEKLDRHLVETMVVHLGLSKDKRKVGMLEKLLAVEMAALWVV